MWDEFLVGNELLVAPILNQGQTQRDVYLPAGRWRASNGTVYSGPITLRAFPAPIEDIPFFVAV